MVFWLSVLVFIAGIMTYMFFPRSDQYALDIFQEEGNVVTFVNQHQAAKDLMYQMISWNPGSNTGIYILPYGDDPQQRYMHATKTELMTPDDINDSSLSLSEGGDFASAIVCLHDCTTEANCVQGKMLIQCPSDEQYVITYGYFPEWWDDGSHRKQAWFRALLKRTHGSTACGVLTDQGAYGGNMLYSINNSQRFNGPQVVAGKRVVPPALTERLSSLGISTCETGGCTENLTDLLFCMTPFQNPYRGSPVFHWDSVNNNGTEHQSGLGARPLIGTFSNGNEITPNGGLPVAPYTLTGVVQQAYGIRTLVRLDNNNHFIEQTCNATDCTLSITGGPAVEHIPLNKGYSFTYTVTSEPKQTLTVYYNQYANITDSDGNIVTEATDNGGTRNLVRKEIVTLSESSNTAGYILNQTEIMTDAGTPFINDLRLYSGILTQQDARHNAETDLKRFGL